MPAFPAAAQSEPAIPYDAMPQIPTGTTLPDHATPPASEYVLLLHGLGRTSYAMSPLAKMLAQEGYRVRNLHYDATQHPLPVHIRNLLEQERRALVQNESAVNFVCHGLGCLVVRGMIHQQRPANLGRVVMLTPPNQGGELAEYIRDNQLNLWLFGASTPTLGTRNKFALAKLIGNQVDYATGILTGNDWNNAAATAIIHGRNIGNMTIEHTFIDGMTDHKSLPLSQDALLTDVAAFTEILAFLKHGAFANDDVLPHSAE